MKLKTQLLSAESFAPFGQIVTQPAAEPMVTLEGLEYWGDLAQFPDVGDAIGIGYATLRRRPLVQNCAERHMWTSEVFVPLGGDMVVVVGPPEHINEPERLPPLDRFAAFRVAQGQAILMKPGVWHWAPFPLVEQMSFLVFVRQGTAQTDVTISDFPNGATLEIAA
jgi:ureidoglycolate lyase